MANLHLPSIHPCPSCSKATTETEGFIQLKETHETGNPKIKKFDGICSICSSLLSIFIEYNGEDEEFNVSKMLSNGELRSNYNLIDVKPRG